MQKRIVNADGSIFMSRKGRINAEEKVQMQRPKSLITCDADEFPAPIGSVSRMISSARPQTRNIYLPKFPKKALTNFRRGVIVFLRLVLANFYSKRIPPIKQLAARVDWRGRSAVFVLLCVFLWGTPTSPPRQTSMHIWM
jgi:hypothetical protein